MKTNLTKFVAVGLVICMLFIGTEAFAASNTNSTVSGEIISGEFSLSQPNDLSFTVQLNGEKQIVQLDNIQTKVIDYRGIEDGWQVVVKSSNYDKYKDNYTLIINNQQITDSNAVVLKYETQTMVKEVDLSTQVEVLANAKAGIYGANLEWNLQPNIQNSINE